MRKTTIFRSTKLALTFILCLLLTNCSYPSIELHQSISAVTSVNKQPTNEKMDQIEPEVPQSDLNINDDVFFAEKDQIESIDSVADGNNKSGSEGQQSDREQNVEEEKVTGELPLKKIAITFDDGPDLKHTPRILDILQDKDVLATFYVVGMQVNKYPDVLKRIESEGHLIGNHSYFHPNFTKLSKKELEKEIKDTDEQIFAVLGHVPTTVRPPYGSINDKVKKQLQDLGKETVLWNIDPRDWDGTSVDDMFDNIMENARDGGNILLHSFGSKHVENTVQLLPKIIDELRNQGYDFVTVDELP